MINDLRDITMLDIRLRVGGLCEQADQLAAELHQTGDCRTKTELRTSMIEARAYAQEIDNKLSLLLSQIDRSEDNGAP